MLRSQPGIHSVKVALLAERGVVEFDPLQWNVAKVINVSKHFRDCLQKSPVSDTFIARKYRISVSMQRLFPPLVQMRSPCAYTA